MNTDRTDTSCCDDCSQSDTSTTSSHEDLAWDNYSPPLRACTDECSCTQSASQCTSCGRLTSCHSCVGGPCSSLKSWPESKVPSSMDRTTPSPSAWPCSRGNVRRGETDSQLTVDDLKSIESPSCSRASRLESQDDILETSVVLSGKPSSASIDFRRKCTAYWDGVRSLQSLASSSACPVKVRTATDTGTSVYSLLSLPNSESSHQSALRIFQSFRTSDGTARVDRISLARTVRPHSADDICRLRIASDKEKRPCDEDPTNGHRTKRICSAVQFSQVVTTHCYDNEFSHYTALEGRDCSHSGSEDQEEHKERRGKINAVDDACSLHCKDVAVPGDNTESEHTEEKDYISNGRRHRHHSNRGQHSKKHRYHGQSSKQQRDRDQPCQDHIDLSKDQCSYDPNSTDHNEDSLLCRDHQSDCCQCCKDIKDQCHYSRNHTDTRLQTLTQNRHHRDSKLKDNCHDSEDRLSHVHHLRQHDDHWHGSKDRSEHGICKRDPSKDYSEHGISKRDHSKDQTEHEICTKYHSKDHSEHGICKKDHSKDHSQHGICKTDHSEDQCDQRNHSREHNDSNKYRDKKNQCIDNIDSRHDITDPIGRGQPVKDSIDRCCDSKENTDHGRRGKEHRDRSHESRDQFDHFHHRRDKWPYCCDSKDNTSHEHHEKDIEKSSHDSEDQNVYTHRQREHSNSYASRDNIERNSQLKGLKTDRHLLGNLDLDFAHNSDSDRRNGEHQRFESYSEDQSCFEDCTRKKNHVERQYYKQQLEKFKDDDDTCSHQIDNVQHNDHMRHKDNEGGFWGPHNDNEGHSQHHQDRKHSDCLKSKKKDSMDEIRKVSSFRKCKDFESYSYLETDFDDYVKELKRRQSRDLGKTRCYLDVTNYEEEQESEERKRTVKKEIAESEVCLEKMMAKYEEDSEFKIDSISSLLLLSSSKACKNIQPECRAEERQLDLDIRFCDYPEVIPPLDYFLGRAVVRIEGDLDELPQNASPFLYKPQPLPVRNSNLEPAKDMFFIEPVTEVRSRQSFEPRLEFPPQSQRTPSRISAQVAPSIITAQPAVYMPGRMSKTPVVAYQSTVEGSRLPTSIRGKAENMPILCRFAPMQMGDSADIGQIEPMSKKQSKGLKPELVSSDLKTIAASITPNSFVENERRLPSKTVAWVQQVAPNPSIVPGSIAAANPADDSTPSYTSHDRHSTIDPRLTTQSVNPSPENRESSYSPGSRVSSIPVRTTLRSILVGSRVTEESRISSTAGGSRLSSIPGGNVVYPTPGESRVSSVPRESRGPSTPGGNRVSSTPGGSRLSSFPNYGRLTSYDEPNSYAYPENSDISVGPQDARYSIIPNFDNNRHSFGYSHRRTTVHLNRQTNLNPNGLIISQFDPQPQVLVAAPKVAQEDAFYLDPSSTGVEIIPAIHDITVQIPSLTAPPQPTKPAKSDNSELVCLKELLAVPLSGQNNSDSEISADSNGQLCKASSRSSDPGFDTSTSGVPLSQPQRSSKRPIFNAYPSENCLCTSVTQVVSRSTKHGTSGESDACTAVRDKRSSSYRSKWYRSLSSKTIHDIPSEGSIPDRTSSQSETRSPGRHLSRTSTWVDCYTLPGSELHHLSETCTNAQVHRDVLRGSEYGEEMRETSSCTDSVTTIYTRLPTSSARRRSLNCCTLATEPRYENCFTTSTRCSEEFEQRPVTRNCRQSSPAEAKVSYVHCCPPAGDRIISSTVVASRRHPRCKTDDSNDGGILREQTFERKYKALKRFCIETLGCVPPQATSMCFE